MNFNPGCKYSRPNKEGSYERRGDRIIKLGLNVYSSNKPVDTIIPPESKHGKKMASQNSDFDSNVPDPKSKAQLDLLCKLIGKSRSSKEPNDFKLNLFNNDEEEL